MIPIISEAGVLKRGDTIVCLTTPDECIVYRLAEDETPLCQSLF